MTNKKKKHGSSKQRKSQHQPQPEGSHSQSTQQRMEQQGNDQEPLQAQQPDSASQPSTEPSISSITLTDENGKADPQTTQNAQRYDVYATSSRFKEEGNDHYGKKEWAKAAKAYRAGLEYLVDATELEGCSSSQLNQLKSALRSNLAMVLLKLEQFSMAELECTCLLELEPTNAKALYRRALAREGIVMYDHSSSGSRGESPDRSGCPSHEDRVKLILKAQKDLNLCLTLVCKDDPSSPERKRMMKVVETALGRVEQTYGSLTNSQPAQITPCSPAARRRSNGSNATEGVSLRSAAISIIQNDSLSTPHHSGAIPPPPPEMQQKKDVTTLLLSRKTASNKLQSTPPKGEAFFLVDWNWWCHWCQHVDFFYTNEIRDCRQPGNANVKERAEMVLRMLPPGAVRPPSRSSKGLAAATGSRSSVGTTSTSSDDESDSDDEDDFVLVGPPGVIDNSRLLFVQNGNSSLRRAPLFFGHWYDTTSLRPNLVRGHHYELLPREVYSALRSWYGEVTPSVCRRTNDEGVVTLYPTSSSEQFSRATSHEKCSACRAPHAKSRCKRCLSVRYCNRACQEGHWPFHKLLCKSLAEDGNNHRSNGTGPDTSWDRHAGRVGLNNLGNTCFMNSALQCLSHATPLTRHFLSNQFKADLNTANPLGTGGKLANAYDAVMKDLWMRHNNHRSVGAATSPTALKRAIALFAPRFAGCLQHDAQEFLAYLLDGLHEDLNRIRKAPYVEMPDVTNGQNMAIAGADAWDAHRRRNDSLVMDSFYGQFKSTCVCPKCERVSVSFDAFNHVSLEIPQLQNKTLTVPVMMFRSACSETFDNNNVPAKHPLRFGVSVQRNSIVEDLRRGLAELVGVPMDRIMLCDVYENSIYEILNDKKPVTSLSADVLTAYEVDVCANSSFHAVLTHSALMSVLDPTAMSGDSQEQRRLFGFPLMTSFDSDLTCREVWDHVWNLVDYMVVQEGSRDGFVDESCRYRREDVLQLHVVDNQGNPRAVFGGSSPIVPEQGKIDSSHAEMDSRIPMNLDIKIRDFLGPDCTDNFLFISLEWNEPRSELPDEDDETKITKEEVQNVAPLVQHDRFVVYGEHPSFTEAFRKRRPQNGVKGVSLDQCFETFTKPERLDENNMWYCSKCKEHVRALKTMKLWRLPNILVVHLKRFEFKHAFRRDKLDTFVDFPLDGLDMNRHCADWCAGDDGESKSFVDGGVPAEYDLFAVVNHYGRMGFGHYTAYARQWDETGISKEWALFDDSSVKIVGDGRGDGGVVTPAAYVLFYRRRVFN